MATIPSAKIHNVALIGQSGSGKTTLLEALLHCSGVLSRKGRVEDGSTVSDFESEEIEHRASFSTALARLESGGHRFTILDTPGLPDFIAEAEAALSVADVAVVVVSATDRLGAHIEALWEAAARRNLPRIVFVNKLDADRAEYEAVLDECRSRFGEGVAPLELPISEGGRFVGVADLLADEAIVVRDGISLHVEIPAEIAELEQKGRENLVEGIVVGDEELMARYLDGEVPSVEELENVLATGLAEGIVSPVLCGSALGEVGLERLLAFIGEVSHHRSVGATAGTERVEVFPDSAGPLVVRVFKTAVDPFLGKLSYLHVCSGTLRPDVSLVNVRTRGDVRVHLIEEPSGKTMAPVFEAVAGEIVVVPKIADLVTGDTLVPRDFPVVVDAEPCPCPLVSVAIRPCATGDDERMMTALHRLTEEDSGLSIHYEEETHQTVIGGMGDQHLQIALERLARKFHVSAETEPVAIAYRQTITRPADAEGRYKKQTGGHGQFGIAHIRIEPAPPGSGFEFVDRIVGGSIPRQFIPAVEKGVRRAMGGGGPAALPVVDVRVTVDDGKFHPVDSSEASFEQAGALAFLEAMAKAEPVVLEPIHRLDVAVPSRLLGDVLSDLGARRARVLDSEVGEDGLQHVTAEAPAGELARYGVELRALTGGYGTFSVAHDDYAPAVNHAGRRGRVD